MITRNLWTSGGLVNGTMGTVYDMVWENGVEDPFATMPAVIPEAVDDYVDPASIVVNVVSYDNMNFYEHRRDQRMTNKGHQSTGARIKVNGVTVEGKLGCFNYGCLYTGDIIPTFIPPHLAYLQPLLVLLLTIQNPNFNHLKAFQVLYVGS